MKFFSSEKDDISEKHLNIENKPSKFKYINFRDPFSLIITVGTNQLTEAQ